MNWIGWAEYPNKYPLLFSSGEKFDMAYTATWLNYSSLAQKGAFKSLDEMWPKYAPKNFERQSESALQQATVDGHYYCIPTLLATYSAYGPIYRTDILEAHGLERKDGEFCGFGGLSGCCEVLPLLRWNPTTSISPVLKWTTCMCRLKRVISFYQGRGFPVL